MFAQIIRVTLLRSKRSNQISMNFGWRALSKNGADEAVLRGLHTRRSTASYGLVAASIELIPD